MPIMTHTATALRLALLAHAEHADARPGLVIGDAAYRDLNLALAVLADIGRTTPEERRRASHRMCKPATRLRNLAALLTR
jgi:hypothetical protein